MNKEVIFMKRFLFFLLLFVFSLTIIMAQTTQQQPQRRFLSEEVQYLVRLIRDLPQLDKDKKLAITKDQAKKLIPILEELGKRQILSPKDAQNYSDKIEKILTDPQLTYLDKLQIERQKRLEELRRQWQSQNQQTQQNQQRQNFPQNPQGSQRNPQISEEERQAMTNLINSWQKGKYLNPFFYLPSWKKTLNDLINILKKK